MKNYYFLFILPLVFVGVFVFAQDELAGVTYPVAELGNCGSQMECETYCDLEENMAVCLDFAELHNLLPPLEIKMARDMIRLSQTAGPGGCQGYIKCAAYCDEISHIEECVTFAEEHGLIPPEELEDAKKVIAAMEKGLTPPNCKNKSECDVYCQEPEHMEECITFGEAAGLIPPEELEDAKKALEAVKKGVKPPACKGKAECDIYCAEPEHLEECLTFAEAAGFISPEDAAMARKIGGKGPGGCRGKEVCDAFCENPANMEECINFGEEFGFMSHEEAEQAKKMLTATLTGGPGGCKGKEECDAYCNDVTHMEECLLFAEAAGLIPPEQLEESKKIIEAVKKGVHMLPCRNKEECDVYCSQPENMEECINFAVATGNMPPEEAEKAKRGMEMMQAGGLGGCKSKEECKAYCDDPAHGMECMNYAIEHGLVSPEEAQQMQQQMMQMQQMQQMQPSEGMMPPEGAVPQGLLGPAPSALEGKCINAQECEQYCANNPTDPGCLAALKSPPLTPPEVPPPQVPQAPQITPPEFLPQPPSPEEIERIKQEEMQKAREQIQQVIPQGLTPPSGVPPSFETPP